VIGLIKTDKSRLINGTAVTVCVWLQSVLRHATMKILYTRCHKNTQQINTAEHHQLHVYNTDNRGYSWQLLLLA